MSQLYETWPELKPSAETEVDSDSEEQVEESDDGTTRVSQTGMVQKGIDLGGVNNFLKGLGLREMTDIKSAYQDDTDVQKNTDLTGFSLSDTDSEYDVSDGAYPGKQTAFNQTASTPETTSQPQNVQDGASDKPDIADSVRAVRVARGARQQEFASRPGNGAFGGEEPDDSSLVSPMYANKKRNEIREAFLDMSKGSVRASIDSAAVAGRYRDVMSSQDLYSYDGKAVKAKEGMESQAREAAMMGLNPTEFLAIPDAPEQTTKITEQQAKDAGAAFAQDYITRIKNKDK